MNHLLLACALTLCGSAFADDETCHHPANAAADSHPATPAKHLVRGEPLKGLPVVPLEELLKTPDVQSGKVVRLEGNVRKSCTRMGCWMELAQGPKGPGVRVTFKDYGFVVPVDSAGARAKVEGTVKVASLSDEQVAHYTSEGAQVTRGTDGKAREVQIVASGVELDR